MGINQSNGANNQHTLNEKKSKYEEDKLQIMSVQRLFK